MELLEDRCYRQCTTVETMLSFYNNLDSKTTHTANLLVVRVPAVTTAKECNSPQCTESAEIWKHLEIVDPSEKNLGVVSKHKEREKRVT
ncbi:hypothetical protein KQX54_020648 [Cotesia glomerata]|uniref:Uncharacterized protein n=1 Tax=Cotesia glomerata TaxID=32391 RepID=A0AAV7J5W9_COTGL|nr:hypothetical protein KQX54_020648 [Cotesia glomerata]